MTPQHCDINSYSRCGCRWIKCGRCLSRMAALADSPLWLCGHFKMKNIFLQSLPIFGRIILDIFMAQLCIFFFIEWSLTLVIMMVRLSHFSQQKYLFLAGGLLLIFPDAELRSGCSQWSAGGLAGAGVVWWWPGGIIAWSTLSDRSPQHWARAGHTVRAQI